MDVLNLSDYDMADMMTLILHWFETRYSKAHVLTFTADSFSSIMRALVASMISK